MQNKGKEFLSQLKLYSDYLKWNSELGRYETWEEACDDVLNTHTQKYGDRVKGLLDEVRPFYYAKDFLPSQRNLQFRGKHILRNNAKLYNCCVTYAYSPDVFNKGFFVLLSGTGLGVSLKKKFVSQLPNVFARNKGAKNYVVEDSIEGWSDAAKVLISSYCKHPSLIKEYFGYQIKFDFSKIRAKGAYISGGFKAPGPEGLRQSLEKIEKLLNDYIGDAESKEFKSIIAYDILMHLSDAVLSGGVRRSAMNIMMDEDDTDLINAKVGDWRSKHPHRARSNNSVQLLRGTFEKSKFKKLVELNTGDNDLGFVFSSHEDDMYNPCFTINQRVLTDQGWRSFKDLLGTTPNIVQDNRVWGKLKEGKEVWEYDLSKKGTITNTATQVKKTGENKDVYLIETFCGREVEATEDHDFATTEGMVKLKDLKNGDKLLVGIPEETYIPNKETYNYLVGFLYGMYYGDGTDSGTSAIIDIWESKKTTQSILNLVKDRVEKVISAKESEIDYKGNTKTNPTFSISKETDVYTKYRMQSYLLKRIFELEGFEGKEDLDNLHLKDKDFKTGFISGFFYTDGHVEASSKSVSLRITQTNKKALQNTMLVLQELGIFSKIYSLQKSRFTKFRETEKEYFCKDSFRLVIPDVKNCIKAISTLELFDYKKEKIENFLKTAANKKTSNFIASVKNITYLGKEDVYCLEENNNRTLIAEGLTARRCFEISFNFYDQLKNKNEAVFQFCNLCEINASAAVDKHGKFSEEKFYKLCRAATIIGTLQAGYTTFEYLGKQTEEIVAGESLLGVSVTGWMTRPELFNKEILEKGANICKEVNKEVADIIGINYAARITTTKPSGNASVILKTSSGIHPEHSKRYFRIMQLNKQSETAAYLLQNMPDLLEESVWSNTNSDYVVFVPIENEDGTQYKDEMQGVKHLELIKLVQEYWVMKGKNEERCYNKTTNHNVSNTVIIDNTEEITDYIYEHQNIFAAVSFISPYGDKDYNQAPFTSVMNTEELVKEYGDGVIFMAGLIVDGLHYFNNNLWEAADHVVNKSMALTGTREQVLLKKDWIRRVEQFSKNYFRKDIKKTIYCMKDVHLWHKWNTISRVIKPIDFTEILKEPTYSDIDKYSAIACSGGACEVDFSVKR